MSARELYKRFTLLCHKWPKDHTKAGRDYGELFRAQLGKHFPQGELGRVDNPAQVELELSSLERLANNIYFNENPLKRSSSTGLEVSSCREAISNVGIRIIQEQEESSLLSKLKDSLSMKFAQSKSNNKISKIDDHDGADKKKDQ